MSRGHIKEKINIGKIHQGALEAFFEESTICKEHITIGTAQVKRGVENAWNILEGVLLQEQLLLLAEKQGQKVGNLLFTTETNRMHAENELIQNMEAAREDWEKHRPENHPDYPRAKPLDRELVGGNLKKGTSAYRAFFKAILERHFPDTPKR